MWFESIPFEQLLDLSLSSLPYAANTDFQYPISNGNGNGNAAEDEKMQPNE